jgi:hypothetical protein
MTESETLIDTESSTLLECETILDDNTVNWLDQLNGTLLLNAVSYAWYSFWIKMYASSAACDLSLTQNDSITAAKSAIMLQNPLNDSMHNLISTFLKEEPWLSGFFNKY